MKWRPISERAQEIIVAPIAIPLAVVFIPVVVLAIWLPDKIQALKRKHFGPFFQMPQKWFAWHPVKLDWEPHQEWSCQWIWLEVVDRQLERYVGWGISYRLPDPPS